MRERRGENDAEDGVLQLLFFVSIQFIVGGKTSRTRGSGDCRSYYEDWLVIVISFPWSQKGGTLGEDSEGSQNRRHEEVMFPNFSTIP